MAHVHILVGLQWNALGGNAQRSLRLLVFRIPRLEGLWPCARPVNSLNAEDCDCI